jgi:hypothetical protein
LKEVMDQVLSQNRSDQKSQIKWQVCEASRPVYSSTDIPTFSVILLYSTFCVDDAGALGLHW